MVPSQRSTGIKYGCCIQCRREVPLTTAITVEVTKDGQLTGYLHRESGFPSKYICSDCNWSFPISRLSDLREFFQQKDAIQAFSTHDCALFPFMQKEASRQREKIVVIHKMSQQARLSQILENRPAP